MKPYLLDGKEAQGKDYITPLESLSDDEDMRIGIPGEGGLIVSAYSEGFFVTEERADGSTFLATGLTKERVKQLLEGFLSGSPDWRRGLEWELTTFPKRVARRRTLILVLGGAVLVVLVWWLTEHLAK